MEQENNKKGIVAFLMMLVIALLVVCGLYEVGVLEFKNNKSKEEDKKEIGIKIDSSKEYVYDAEYKYTNKYTEFSRGTNIKDLTINEYAIPVLKSGKEYLKDLKVPYINIKSDAATKANSELEKIYLEKAKQFDECASSVINKEDAEGCSLVLTYKTYSYNDILSVVVIKGEQATAPWNIEYNIYNFDLKTGSLISYNDMLNKLEFSKDDTFNRTKDLMKSQMNKVYNDIGEDLNKACHNAFDENNKTLYNTTNCYEASYKILEQEINSNKALFFVDNNGNLNLLSILYYDGIQSGDSIRYLLTLSK